VDDVTTTARRFWSKPGAFTPWAVAATTPQQRGDLRTMALSAGVTLASVGGKSPRGPWHIALTDASGARVVDWYDRQGDLYGNLVLAIAEAANHG